MRTTIHLPDDLLRRDKQKAVSEGRTLTSLIEEGLRIVTAGSASAPTGQRVLPRVSRATGGLRPGIDPDKINARTQELEDHEMLDRIARQWAEKA